MHYIMERCIISWCDALYHSGMDTLYYGLDMPYIRDRVGKPFQRRVPIFWCSVYWSTPIIFLCTGTLFHFSLTIITSGSGNLSSLWSRVNAQMRTSLPSPSSLSCLPLIDSHSLCSQSLPRKGYQFTSHALRVLSRALIYLPLVKAFHFCLYIFVLIFCLTFQL